MLALFFGAFALLSVVGILADRAVHRADAAAAATPAPAGTTR